MGASRRWQPWRLVRSELFTMLVPQDIAALTRIVLPLLDRFLVLPRMIAVTLMLPLLCVYADLLGVIGGAAVSIGIINIAPRTYIETPNHRRPGRPKTFRAASSRLPPTVS